MSARTQWEFRPGQRVDHGPIPDYGMFPAWRVTATRPRHPNHDPKHPEHVTWGSERRTVHLTQATLVSGGPDTPTEYVEVTAQMNLTDLRDLIDELQAVEAWLTEPYTEKEEA